MRKVFLVLVFGLAVSSHALATSQDTFVFRNRMLPDNEIPAITAPGNSANATITIHVTRDEKANVSAATVTFDIDYTITSAVTFTGLHIHNGPADQNGPVVINTGISANNSLSAVAGSGKITRVVNYTSTDAGLTFVTGLLAAPQNYYVNIHTTVNPGGFMRAQLQASRIIFRPVMSQVFEVPPVNVDAAGAALVDVQVNRDPQTGVISSGTVIFDVDYRFSSPVTITGLHIHNGAAGVNGPVVIDTGTNATSTAIVNATRGNIFRVVEITSSNAAGLAALNGLFTDPTQYYINMHTTANPGGVIRGQLTKNIYVFFNQMTQAEENPPTGVSGTADSMTYVRIDRDTTGNAVAGGISFNVDFDMGSPQTFTGLHIHNGKSGVNGPVVINSGLSASNTVFTPTGSGSIRQEMGIQPGDASFDFLRGLVENPENYYINIHTTQFPGGVVRAQLARETYHYKANMVPANEVPPVTGADTAATGWITAKVNRDANGIVNGGAVTFDVNYTNTGAVTFTGLHIHYPAPAGVNAPVTISSGIGGGNGVGSTTGNGNITLAVPVDSSNSAAMAALNALITAPDTAYVNIHTTQFPGGAARSQMFPIVNTVAQVAGGSDWTSMITVRNPSATSSVMGILDLFQSNGNLFPEAISHPNIWFLIPPSSSATINTHNKGNLTPGFAKVFSNASVAVESRYINPAFTSDNSTATTVTARSVSIPVAVSDQPARNTGISLIADSAATLNLSLRDSNGNIISGGSRSINVTAGQQISSYVTELLPTGLSQQYTGTLTITTSAGMISVLALQFDGSTPPALAKMSPVVVTGLP